MKKQKIKKLYVKFLDEGRTLKDNPIFSLLVFSPATVISSILIIPGVVLTLPLLLFKKKIQNIGLKFMLYFQHSISLSVFFIAEEVLVDFLLWGVKWPESFEWSDLVYGSLGAFFILFRSIKKMVKETMEKYN